MMAAFLSILFGLWAVIAVVNGFWLVSLLRKRGVFPISFGIVVLISLGWPIVWAMYWRSRAMR